VLSAGRMSRLCKLRTRSGAVADRNRRIRILVSSNINQRLNRDPSALSANGLIVDVRAIGQVSDGGVAAAYEKV
jgi:hypothetical protein